MTYVLLLKNYLKQITLALMCLIAVIANAQNQTPVQTEGTDFWFGYMENSIQVPDYVLQITIAAREQTDGIVDIPGQNYSQPFSVGANSVTIVAVPIEMVEHTSNETLDNKGIHDFTEDTVSVVAVNRQEATHDDTYILTNEYLGNFYCLTRFSHSSSLGGIDLTLFGKSASRPFLYNSVNGIYSMS